MFFIFLFVIPFFFLGAVVFWLRRWQRETEEGRNAPLSQYPPDSESLEIIESLETEIREEPRNLVYIYVWCVIVLCCLFILGCVMQTSVDTKELSALIWLILVPFAVLGCIIFPPLIAGIVQIILSERLLMRPIFFTALWVVAAFLVMFVLLIAFG